MMSILSAGSGRAFVAAVADAARAALAFRRQRRRLQKSGL